VDDYASAQPGFAGWCSTRRGTRVLVLIDGLRIRVLSEDGELIRELTLDPSRDYQPRGRA